MFFIWCCQINDITGLMTYLPLLFFPPKGQRQWWTATTDSGHWGTTHRGPGGGCRRRRRFGLLPQWQATVVPLHSARLPGKRTLWLVGSRGIVFVVALLLSSVKQKTIYKAALLNFLSLEEWRHKALACLFTWWMLVQHLYGFKLSYLSSVNSSILSDFYDVSFTVQQSAATGNKIGRIWQWTRL